MKTSQGPGQDGQGRPRVQGGPTPPAMPGGQQPPYPVPPSMAQRPAQWQKPPQQGSAEASDIGNVTLFRTAQFFVHAVSGQRQRNAQRSPAGNTSLLEQVRWVSTERQRVIETETRLLPDIALINPRLQREIIIPGWLEAVVVVLVLGIAMVVHGINLFGFPFYQQDEGVLMSNAWAVTHGLLEPYAYTYNQTFLGWVQLAGWSVITGGFATFGNAINSGRALMFVLTCGSALFVYLTTNRLSGSRSAGLLAMVLFTLSPLGITYQREVLLDNIGTFWLLLSLYLVVVGNSRLLPIVMSGVALGIAVLTKEVFIIFFPVMLYAVALHATTFQRKFSIVVFTYIVLSLVSTFALLAILKGELLPTGVLPWDHHQHPSLWAGMIDNIESARQSSNFSATWQTWMQSEWPLFAVSAVAVGINLFAGWRSPLRSLIALLLITFWAFMLLTNIIFASYLVICLPLMALNIAVAVNALIKWPSKRFGFDLVRVMLIFGIIGAIVPYRAQHAQVLMIQNASSAQVSALNWIRANVPGDSTLIVDSYLYADLHEPGGAANRVYPHTQYYWNAELDPDIRITVLHNDWTKIDYVVVDAQMQQDIRTRPGAMVLLDRAIHHGTLLQTFQAANHDPAAVVQIYQVIH